MTKKKDGISSVSFRVRYLRRSRELYRRYLEAKPWVKQLYTQFLGLKPRLKIVDVGCGTGDFTRFLANLAPASCHLTGIDTREASLRAADNETRKAGLARRVSFRRGDAYDIPMRTGFADLTCCRTLLMHLQDPVRAVKEMARITKPNGLVAAAEGGRMNSFYDPEDEAYSELSLRASNAWLRGIRKLDGREFRIGEKLPSIFQKAGLTSIMAEAQGDAWLDCDPRRKLRDIKEQLKFERATSKETRNLDRRYLRAGGMSRSEVNNYFHRYEARMKRLLSDDTKLRENTSFYGAGFIIATGRNLPTRMSSD